MGTCLPGDVGEALDAVDLGADAAGAPGAERVVSCFAWVPATGCTAGSAADGSAADGSAGSSGCASFAAGSVASAAATASSGSTSATAGSVSVRSASASSASPPTDSATPSSLPAAAAFGSDAGAVAAAACGSDADAVAAAAFGSDAAVAVPPCTCAEVCSAAALAAFSNLFGGAGANVGTSFSSITEIEALPGAAKEATGFLRGVGASGGLSLAFSEASSTSLRSLTALCFDANFAMALTLVFRSFLATISGISGSSIDSAVTGTKRSSTTSGCVLLLMWRVEAR
mmetsp:Transcript_29766/g.65048  ORF Transcript_29766/g.65048 Transcript_29766/m.65048 type:complete len:286 (+) Transcript_29766:753-1610(+)